MEKGWLRRQIWSWDEIRPIGQSPLVRASIFFPAIGYLLLLNSHALEWAVLAPEFQVWEGGAPWRLVLLYYGLVFLAVGTLIFTVRCPTAVKRWPTMKEYVDYLLPLVMAAPHRLEDGLDVLRAGIEYDEDRPKGLSDDLKNVKDLLIPKRPLSPDEAKIAVEIGLNDEWVTYSTNRIWSRGACLAAFACGFLILAIPTVQTFVEVTLWIMRNL